MNLLNVLTNCKNMVATKMVLKRKPGSDDIVMKVGFIAVALAIIVLWKSGILGLVENWITQMTTQSANFWTTT